MMAELQPLPSLPVCSTLGTMRPDAYIGGMTENDTQGGPSLVRILRDILAVPDLEIVQLKANEAGVLMQVGTAAQAGEIRTIATNAGWSVTRGDGRSISIEPPNPLSATVPAGAALYHVSDARNREGIKRDGLKTGTGGNTTLNRTYTPRLHLCPKLGAALTFVNFQTTSHPPVKFDPDVMLLAGSLPEGPRDLGELDLYLVKARLGMEFFQDSHFEDAVWTASSFDAEEVRLLPREDWVGTYKALYPSPPAGVDEFAHMRTDPNASRPFPIHGLPRAPEQEDPNSE